MQEGILALAYHVWHTVVENGAMSPRGDPAKIYAAQRAGTFQRLVTKERLTERRAEALIASWELHAELTVVPRGTHYWFEADRWMTEQLALERR